MESPYECGIKPPGSISDGISYMRISIKRFLESAFSFLRLHLFRKSINLFPLNTSNSLYCIDENLITNKIGLTIKEGVEKEINKYIAYRRGKVIVFWIGIRYSMWEVGRESYKHGFIKRQRSGHSNNRNACKH